MSNKSSSMKNKPDATKKEVLEKMDQVATLMTAMEATLMEWEVWFRLIKMQKISLERGEITKEELEFFINDGPPFTDIPGKIMESIRKQIPDFKQEKESAPVEKNKILDQNGMIAAKEPQSPVILGPDGTPKL